MSMRIKIFSICFLAAAGLGLAFAKLCASTMYVFDGATSSFVSLLSLAKVAAVFYGVHLLP
jgi:hypothetical protein